MTTGGRQGEADPGEHRPRDPSRLPANGESHLAAGRPRQELAEGDEIGEFLRSQPAPPPHKLLLEEADVGGRTAEGDATQLEEAQEDLAEARARRSGVRRRAFTRRSVRREGHAESPAGREKKGAGPGGANRPPAAGATPI